MDPITMMVASIGMQFFNNYANSKKNKEIQKKQRDFQKAAAEHDFERMRKLQAESAKLALELEAEVHKERVEDINSNYDALLDSFAHSFAIKNWPLNVLPFVMKGESFGTLFNGTIQSVNLHCILTPSNSEWFNQNFYDDIDLRLEAEMNNNWNAQTTHPIVYYGGAWNRRTKKKWGSVPDVVNLVDIDLLKIQLKDIPVIVITPYFDPWLHFKVKLWGMGKDSDPYIIRIPHGNDVEDAKRIFSYDYHNDNPEITDDDFVNTTIEEFVPYLECLIGFIADKYFWSMYKQSPKLPQIIVSYKMDINSQLKETITNNYQYEIKQAISSLKCASLPYDDFECYLNSVSPIISESQFKEYESNGKAYNEFLPVIIDEKPIPKFREVLTEKCDILSIIHQYEKFLEKTPHITIDPTLVIENSEYRTLCVYVIDEHTNKQIDMSDSFAFTIKFQRMVRDKNTRYLFRRYAINGLLKIRKSNIENIKKILNELMY